MALLRLRGTIYLIPYIAQGPGLHSCWPHKWAELLHNTQQRHSSTGEGKTATGDTNRTFLILPSQPAFSLHPGRAAEVSCSKAPETG